MCNMLSLWNPTNDDGCNSYPRVPTIIVLGWHLVP
jgi:hypothetical protein